MEFTFLDDPGVKIHHEKRDANAGISLKDLDTDDSSQNDSIVEKWNFVFEKVWYVGHIFIMTTSLLSILLCITRQVLKPWPRLIYRSTFFAATLTYGISLIQNLNGAEPGFYALLPLTTFQYLILSVLWTFTIPHTTKLVPFALYSLLHVADAASEHHSTSKSRSRIAHGLSDNLAPRVLDALGYLDMWLIVELAVDCLLIRPGAVVSILIFLFFYRIKLMYSPSAYAAFKDCYDRTDKYLSRKETPKRVRELWIRLRNKFQVSELQSSELHKEDTENAIERVNLFDTLGK